MHSGFSRLGFFICLLLVGACASSNPPATFAAGDIWPRFMADLRPGISESKVPALLPHDVLVVPPADSVPSAQASWSGVWSGWAGKGRLVDMQLAVDSVTREAATLVVVRTVAGQPRLEHETVARFEGNELVGELPGGTVMHYRMRDLNTIEFVWHTNDGGWMAGVLSRSDPTSHMSRVRIPTGMTEGGNAISLNAVVYRPDMAGPYPALIFNHGSTGIGNNPELFALTWVEPNIARWFTRRGWMVVFPQRRGRGGSGGDYAEGLEPDGSGYSVRPEVSLPGVDRALDDLDAIVSWLANDPDADPARLLIGGYSRGGILSIAYAGTRPEKVRGVINFVGGWLGDRSVSTRAINREVFERGARFKRPTLWLYADHDPYYGLAHSRSNFEAFQQAGGVGDFEVLPVAANRNGHRVIEDSELWSEHLERYVGALAQ